MGGRQRVSSGTPWEKIAGYSRAIRVGNMVFVAGTTASDETGAVIATGDAAAQTRSIFSKIEVALSQVGASLADVVRTRMFVTNMDEWENIGKAHAEVLGDIRPAATMVEINRLADPEHLIEIEVDAIVDE